MSERSQFKLPILDPNDWLTPEEVATVLPNTSAKSVREWCGNQKVKGAVKLPSGRWQIPWSSVVEILGFDPRERGGSTAAESPPQGEALPGLEEP